MTARVSRCRTLLLDRYTGGTRDIYGWVRNDNGTVADAVCSLYVGLYAFVTTSDLYGDYAMEFPDTYDAGTLCVSAEDNLPADSAVDLSNSSNEVNVMLEEATQLLRTVSAATAVSNAINVGRRTLTIGATSAGTFSLYGLDGRLVYRRAVTAGRTVVALNAATARSLVAELVSGSDVIRRSVVLH